MKRSNDKNMTTFGRNMRRLRKEHNLRQEDLAKILGMTREKISYYESQAKNPTIEFILRIADFFKVNTDALLREHVYVDGKRRKPGPVPKLEKQVQEVQKLSKDEQKFVSKFLDQVLASKHAHAE